MLDQFDPVGRAVSDANRVRILRMLDGGELCVCQITAVLGLSTATVSKHLSILRLAGLVAQRKDGRWVYYRLAGQGSNPYAAPMLAVVAGIAAADPVLRADAARLAAVRAVPLSELCAPRRAPAATSATECC